ncbi:threonylcarbamoyl-AMP synthase [Candidatus Woesearchaeota archaeon]|nr:threonylcarbamoyl-AMP synthase [Candidatus Woesearchaeota archaeon]
MDIITKQEFLDNKEKYFRKIRQGTVFVYPTDTIYGIGCDAGNPEAVQLIRTIKNRPAAAFSVIAPSKQWIESNCILLGKAREWLAKLPGPYTLILPAKHPTPKVQPEQQTIGVRIPNHWISSVVGELGFPIITTSLNISGEQPLTAINAIPSAMKEHIGFCIDEGFLQGKPSTLVYLDQEGEQVKER